MCKKCEWYNLSQVINSHAKLEKCIVTTQWEYIKKQKKMKLNGPKCVIFKAKTPFCFKIEIFSLLFVVNYKKETKGILKCTTVCYNIGR